MRSSAAIRPSMRHNTVQEARDTVGRAATQRGPTHYIARGDTAGHAYDTATIRLSTRHDTKPNARGLGVVHTQCARRLGQGVRIIH